MPDLVIGRIPVLECLRAGRRRPRELHLLRGGKGLDTIERAASGVPVTYCDRNRLDQLTRGAQHQGVVLEADSLPVFQADDWARRDLPPDALVVALDEVEDPHNFGAIVRSAAAFGAHAVLFGKHRSAPVSATAAKTAAGAMEHIDLVQATNLKRGMQALKDQGFWVAGLDADAGQLLWQADLRGRIVLVIGSEGSGMRRTVRDACDFTLRIPLTGAITSLNASVSAAIALAECVRQRTA